MTIKLLRALCFFLESFRLSLNHIARYALSRNTKSSQRKIHKSLAKQFIEIPLIIKYNDKSTIQPKL